MLAIKCDPRVCVIMEKEKNTHCILCENNTEQLRVFVRGCGCVGVFPHVCIQTLTHITEREAYWNCGYLRLRCVCLYTIASLPLVCVPVHVCVHVCLCVHVFCFHSSAGICERHLTVCASVLHVYAFSCVLYMFELSSRSFVVCCFCCWFHFNLLCAVRSATVYAWWVQAAYFLLSFSVFVWVCVCAALLRYKRIAANSLNCCWLSFRCFVLALSLFQCMRAFIYVLPLPLLLLSSAAIYFLTLALCMPRRIEWKHWSYDYTGGPLLLLTFGIRDTSSKCSAYFAFLLLFFRIRKRFDSSNFALSLYYLEHALHTHRIDIIAFDF